MLYRYLIAGINLLVAGIVLIAYGILVTESLFAVGGAPMIVMGAVLTVMGISGIEPPVKFLQLYSTYMKMNFIKLAEDLNLIPNTIYSVPAEKGAYVIYTSGNYIPRDIGRLAGFDGESSYISVFIPLDIEAPPEVSAEDRYLELMNYLKNYIVDRYFLARRVDFRPIEEGIIEVRLDGMHKIVTELLNPPLNPATALVVAISAQMLGKSVKVISEEKTYTALKVTLEVISPEG